MKSLLAVLLLSVSAPALATPTVFDQEWVGRYCAEQAGLPYGTDNFSDEQWDAFVDCRISFEKN